MDNHTHTTEEYLVIACRQYAESHKDQFMPRATLWQAADTIERLQKERDQLGAGGKVWQRTAGHLKQERDAALAEVERLKGELLGIYSDQAASDQARIEIRRKSDAMGR